MDWMFTSCNNMAVFSKPLTLSYSCYELGHCWTPYCTKASTDIAQSVFKEAFKIYGSLYLIAALLRRKGKEYYLKKYLLETLQSTVFLTLNGSLFIGLFCVWRNVTGFYFYYNTFLCGIPACAFSLLVEAKERKLLGTFYYVNSSFVPACSAAYIAILFERKTRRSALAIYVLNLALETSFRMLVSRGIVRPIWNGEGNALVGRLLHVSCVTQWLTWTAHLQCRMVHGTPFDPPVEEYWQRWGRAGCETFGSPVEEYWQRWWKGRVILFSITSAAYLYLFRKKDELPKSVSSALKYVVGSSEAPPELNANDVKSTKPRPARLGPPSVQSVLDRLRPASVQSVLDRLRPASVQSVVDCLHQTPRHRLCQHPHGCLHYVLQGFCRQFGLGYAIQTVIKFLSLLPKIPFRPSILLHVLFNKESVSLGAFLGCYSAIFKAVNCTLRWVRDRDDSVHGLAAGFLAGGAMLLYRSSVVALYAATKLGELLYLKGIKAGVLPCVKYADILIYSVSTAIAFHAAVLEPHNLRPAYWKFLLRVTGNRFAQMNRRLIDVFGTHASQLYPNYWPDYDPHFTSLNPLHFS